jgi:hypothetical protein
MRALTARTRLVLLAVGMLAFGGAARGADLVPNGSFESGTEGWQLVTTPGAGATMSVAQDAMGKGRCAQVQVVRNDSFTGWEIALQTALSEPLDPSKLYRLSFRAASPEPGHVEVCVQQAEAPYRILHLARAVTGPEPRSLAITLPRATETVPTRLSVWFGNSPVGTYWVDGIAVEPLTPEEEAALAQQPVGWQNGDFSAGLQGWELRVHDAAVAELSLDPEPRFGDGNCARVDVTNATETGWHVQFMQIFNVQKDKTYVATFSAMADRHVEIVVSYQVPPPDNAGFGSSPVTLTAEPKTFSVKSNPITRDTPMKLSFQLSGAGEGTFWFDKVSVTALDEGN